MDGHSHQADLKTLSKLYWLVQNNDSGEPSLVAKVLDEGSSIFLRKLLDDATERVYEAHGKNMTKHMGQQEDHVEMPNRNLTCSPNRCTHKKVVEEKASKVECPSVFNDAIARIQSLIPKLERLSKPYSTSLDSSSASCYEKATSRTRRCNSESDSNFSEYSSFSLSSKTQYGTSQSRTTSGSSFDSDIDHGDDELSSSEYYQPSRRSVGHRKLGKLSRLKEKLGSIFHHHHHHHHHHHNNNTKQHPHDKSVEASGSLWKKCEKMLRSNEKRVEAKFEKKYMGTEKKKAGTNNQKRPAVSRGKHEQRNKQRGGNFQELVGGLMRNPRNLNMPKQGGREKKCSKVTRKPRDKLQQRPRLKQKD